MDANGKILEIAVLKNEFILIFYFAYDFYTALFKIGKKSLLLSVFQNSFDIVCAVKCEIFEFIYGIYEPPLFVCNSFQTYRACLTSDQSTSALVFSLKLCYSSTCYLTDLWKSTGRNYILMIVVCAVQRTLGKKKK